MKKLFAIYLLLPLVCFGQLQYVAKQDVRWYGAKGDGITDDSPAIQRALDATPSGGLITFQQGNYLCGSRLHNRYGVSMQGIGDVKLLRHFTNGNYGGIICFGPWLLEPTISGGFSHWPSSNTWYRITTTNVPAGTSTISLASTSGLATNDVINLRAGYCITDSNLPDWWGRVVITGISGTNITFSPPIPYTLSFATPNGTGNPENPNYLFKDVSYPGYTVENITFSVHDDYLADAISSGSGTGVMICDRGGKFVNVTVERNPTAFILWSAEDLQMINCKVRKSLTPIAGMELWSAGIRVWGAKNVLVDNFQVDDAWIFSYCEGSSDNIVFRNCAMNSVSPDSAWTIQLASNTAHGEVKYEDCSFYVNCPSVFTTSTNFFSKDTRIYANEVAAYIPTDTIVGRTVLKTPTSWNDVLDDKDLTTEYRTVWIGGVTSGTNDLQVYGPIKSLWLKGENFTTNMTNCYLRAPIPSSQDIDILAKCLTGTWQKVNQTVSGNDMPGFLLHLNNNAANLFVNTKSAALNLSPSVTWSHNGSLGVFARVILKVTYWKLNTTYYENQFKDGANNTIRFGQRFEANPSEAGILIGRQPSGLPLPMQFQSSAFGAGSGFKLVGRDPGTGISYFDIIRRRLSSTWETVPTLSIGDTGNVGIGTNAPGYTFDVVGGIHATDYRSSDGTSGITQTNFWTDGGATNWTMIIKNGLVTSLTHSP